MDFAKTVGISCRGPRPASMKERGVPATGRRRKKCMYRCARVAKQYQVESRTHIVGECEVRKEERDVLEEEMGEIDECDMEEFDTLDGNEKTIAILGDRW